MQQESVEDVFGDVVDVGAFDAVVGRMQNHEPQSDSESAISSTPLASRVDGYDRVVQTELEAVAEDFDAADRGHDYDGPVGRMLASGGPRGPGDPGGDGDGGGDDGEVAADAIPFFL